MRVALGMITIKPRETQHKLKNKMQTDFYDEVQKLRKTGNPFAIATVVRAEKPTSAKPGAKAIITEDGKLTGWIGGSCAKPTVKCKAKKALWLNHRTRS